MSRLARVYPWSAVVGQDALKQALLLCAIDPGIGGVLLSGPRGVAKTTLARALGELVAGPFVELPLGASDDRVTGTLDLQSVLQDSQVVFSPGLLARAHQGVLYVDEVNLLPDALVDLLLDAASSGHSSVERDGVSHSHAARFVLIGTMNPEEGELRPQLTDRFGLAVVAGGELPPEQRAQIVLRRLEFDSDPEGFRARHAEAQQQLIERCLRARARAATLSLAGPALSRVTELCYAAGVEGVRADLAMLRAARAHAAWNERDQITLEDVDAVAELALCHRRRSAPESAPPTRGGSGGGSAPPGAGPGSRTTSEPRASGQTSASPASPADGSAAEATSEGSRQADAQGALAPVPVRAAPTPKLPPRLLDSPARRAERRRRGAARTDSLRGKHAGAARQGSVHWFGTLVRAARHPASKLRVEELRYRARRAPAMQHWVLALDCSGSMLRSGALAAAKAVAHALEANALRVGAHVSVLSFQGATTRLEASSQAARATREHAIRQLGGGGGTPLGDALREALELARRRPFHAPDVGKRVVLLTDGRSREQLDSLARTRQRPSPDLELLVIDCERGAVRLGRAAALATALGGQYFHIDALR
ncbi:MAG: Mg-chelatase subunit ChlI [Myxococcaceae bacterium]|nr:Mg-chelatase subunit ChlI [Myxococcaceae bacterium]